MRFNYLNYHQIFFSFLLGTACIATGGYKYIIMFIVVEKTTMSTVQWLECESANEST